MRGTQQTAAPAPSTNATRDQVREQVRQTIQDANQAARDAVQAARDAGNAIPAIPAVPPVPPVPHIGGFTIQNDGNADFNGMPPQVVDISIAFFIMCAVMVIGWPLSRAFGKRIERRGASATLNAASAEQLQRIERAVDAMSIEIERISESQRFMAKLQSGSVTDNDARGLKIPS
jgi:uncharacterized membrane protein YccC